MLDLPKMKAQAKEGNEFRNNLTVLGAGVERFYHHLKDRLETKYLKHSAYATVSLSKLFESLVPSVANLAPSQA